MDNEKNEMNGEPLKPIPVGDLPNGWIQIDKSPTTSAYKRTIMEKEKDGWLVADKARTYIVEINKGYISTRPEEIAVMRAINGQLDQRKFTDDPSEANRMARELMLDVSNRRGTFEIERKN